MGVGEAQSSNMYDRKENQRCTGILQIASPYVHNRPGMPSPCRGWTLDLVTILVRVVLGLCRECVAFSALCKDLWRL